MLAPDVLIAFHVVVENSSLLVDTNSRHGNFGEKAGTATCRRLHLVHLREGAVRENDVLRRRHTGAFKQHMRVVDKSQGRLIAAICRQSDGGTAFTGYQKDVKTAFTGR